MLRVNLGAKVLCGAAALLQVACGITPDWTARKRAAAECPFNYMHYCRHSNYGKECGCVSKQEMEKVLRR
jgi:hypothetical protein